ncbi:MAG: HPr family phosphocarrier protein [candidate division WOR-3 bacterium]
MIERQVTIVNALGIHARPATLVAQVAQRFKSDITVEKDGLEVNAKSVMGVMMLVAAKGSVITIRASGPDEAEAIEALVQLVEDGFGEE